MLSLYKINSYFIKKISKTESVYNLQDYSIQKRIIDLTSKNFFKESFFNRSYCQYLCQKKLLKQKTQFLDMASLMAIYFLIFFMLIKRKPKKNIEIKIIYFGNKEKIPKKYSTKKILKMEKNIFLRREDIKYYFNNILKRCNGEYYFSLKILIKLATYSYNIEKYSPKIFLVSSEYSFTSSILTEFCERKKIFHVNYMHGEKLYEIKDSFFRFHRCYIWDEHYRKLFYKLKAYPNQFKLIKYNDFILDFFPKKNKKKYNKYYLQYGENRDDISKIISYLKKLEIKTGYQGKIRCHPIYTNKSIKKMIPSEMLDMEKNIYDSIFESYYVISRFSTVLYEAYIIGKFIVVDDITDKLSYTKIKELEWIILNKSHTLLSSLLCEVDYV